MRFQQEYTFTQRKEESDRVLSKYPDRVPIICEKSIRSKIMDLDKKKYLVPDNLTTGQFVYVIRNRLSLPSEKAIFLFIGNSIPPSSTCLRDVYEQYKDNDGFLYIQYNEENVFGEMRYRDIIEIIDETN
jgi:GABA(A) receptor-associated protein